MIKTAANVEFPKSKGQVFFEYILLAICLCIIALRATFTENLNPQLIKLQTELSGVVLTLVISTILIVLFAIWLLLSLCSSKFVYRPGLIEIGLFLFIIAALISSVFASNKRAAITNTVTLTAPVFMCMLLVQILDSQQKINLLLITIIAVGIINAYQCAEQFFSINQANIELYEQNPDSFLEPLDIEPGSFDHWHFKHRLYSKDVNGFFITGNSAGSFMMLAIFAGLALLVAVVKGKKLSENAITWIITAALATGIIIFGLILTHSKGATCATIAVGAIFIFYVLFKNQLIRFKTAAVIFCIVLVLASGLAITWYGLSKGTLPGGKSMLVRWQYWHASIQMYADHPLTGVGAGNFGDFYPHYKTPAALETVTDPHNFLLSILTQYGPLGLISFLAIIVLPLLKVIFSTSSAVSTEQSRPVPGFRKFVVVYIILITLSMLLVRPLITKLPPTVTIEEKLAAIVMIFVIPAGIFAIAISLLAAVVFSGKNTKLTDSNINLMTAVLFCGVIGFLLHNFIDFAIFEPGILTTFWAIIACLIALDFHQKGRKPLAFKPSPFVRITVVVVVLVLIGIPFHYALIPVAKASAKTKLAMQEVRYAHQLLDEAAEADPLDPAAPNLNGRFYLQHYNETQKKQPALLKQAVQCFRAAIDRDEANYKNYDKLSEVYNLLAETTTGREKTNWLNKAFDSVSSAVERYPGCGRLQIESAKIAEQLSKTNIAIKHYQKAVEIEDAYRRQFQIMYPGSEIFSRLGEEKYKKAKQRIKQLSEQRTP